MAKLIDGKAVSAACREKIRAEVAALTAEGFRPGLAVIIVGEDPASKTYIKNKKKACEDLGVYSEEHDLPETATEAELLTLVAELGLRPDIHGILVQSPMPGQINEKRVQDAIPPEKDVDAFHPMNVGRIMIGDYRFLPCTPAGIMELIASTGESVEGKNCVVIGRSDIVGKPMAMLMLHQNATVTICHSRTRDLPQVARRADILIVAIGRAKFVGADMVKPGAIVIDVGMDRDENNKLCGDVDFTAVEPIAGYITPVPGGVGPMTITMLMQNTVTAARMAKEKAGKA